jgi:hypothetical protein
MRTCNLHVRGGAGTDETGGHDPMTALSPGSMRPGYSAARAAMRG